MGSVVLDEPSLGLPPVLVTETFRFPMSPLGHKRWVEARQAGSAVPRPNTDGSDFLSRPRQSRSLLV
jgi:hypothetical protein